MGLLGGREGRGGKASGVIYLNFLFFQSVHDLSSCSGLTFIFSMSGVRGRVLMV